MHFVFREGSDTDIDMMFELRNAVHENKLSDPNLISKDDYKEFMHVRGKSWVAYHLDELAGFGFVDLQNHNVWALFVKPSYEGNGIATHLLRLMINWYFSKTKEELWLSTATNTRAERFYEINGWKRMGILSNGEIKFIMNKETWLQSN